MARKRAFDFSPARQYDRFIAVLVLAGLVLSLLVLARFAAESKENEESFRNAVNNLTPAVPRAAPMDIQPFEQAVRVLRRPPTIGLPTNETGLLMPECRVWCPDCRQPVPFLADTCPHCNTAQPKEAGPIQADRKDSDNDGIPDVIELKWGLDPLNPADAMQDADKDGFSNLIEYQNGTSAIDPLSHPDVAELLRLKDIRKRPFPFVFTTASRMPDDKYKCAFRLTTGDRDTFMVAEGGAIGATGFVLRKYDRKSERRPNPMFGGKLTDVDVSTVTIERNSDGATFVLGVGDAKSAMEQEVVLLLTIGDKATEYAVPASGNLELLGEQYKVEVVIGVDDKPPTVVIGNLHTGKKYTVPK